ncbi:metal-dependent hydrolase family protein [Novosphingobium arvoryzae]|uniref:Xaa-Pro dipeptidase n=1 Tax=Novosphingobium arvoryzae TaxID=1256514 RepID=A0A918RJZ6_9SPHN|nr:amidohydrolase family protein [Novosphingobium arvoryzae]GGZ99516.1 Xaa-Pro dipeptidase [Novosphingobium arvoryzae]
MLRPTLALAAALLSGTSALAAPTYIHAGRVIAVPGQTPRGPTTIVVDEGKIVAVQDGYAPAPAGADTIDLKSRTVLPGLIDSHTHLSSDRAGNEGITAFVTDSLPLNAHETYWNGMKTLRAGFTTVRNLGDSDGKVLALKEASRRGWVLAPRIVDAGESISTSGGHMDGRVGMADHVHGLIGTENLCDGADDCRRAVRRQVGRGADVIKFATTGGVNSGTGLATRMFEDEARALVETAHAYGRKVAVHAHGAEGIKLAVRVGADSIEHGTMIDDEIVKLMKEYKTFYVPTLSTVNGYLERLAANPNAYPPAIKAQIDWRIGVTGKSLAKAYPAGVRIAYGTDAGVSKHGRNADEFELLVKFGMPPVEAIKAATVNAAELLGVDKETGTIEVGKAADIIAVDGDPLTDVKVLKAMKFVMARGNVVVTP